MPEEWFELAYINLDKVILHGFYATTEYPHTGSVGIRRRHDVEQVLTEEQKKQVEDLSFKQETQMQNLLRSFVSE